MSKRVSIIISCREELPENLYRTTASLRESLSNRDEIIVVFDGPQRTAYHLSDDIRTISPFSSPRGCAQCRNAGAMVASGEILVLVDGHMRFSPGWLEDIEEHLSANPKHITCGHMQSLRQDWTEIDGEFYAGGYLALFCEEPGRQYAPIAVKWNDTDIGSGSISGVMGANYGLTKDFYMLSMRRPLRILEQWGGDEEILSLCAYLCGGDTYLLPYTVGHVYAAKNYRRPLNSIEVHNILTNRLALIGAMPYGKDDEDERRAMVDMFDRNQMDKIIIGELYKQREPLILEIKEHLESQERSWKMAKARAHKMSAKDNAKNKHKRKSIPKDDAQRSIKPPPGLVELSDSPPESVATNNNVRQVVERKMEICDRCGAIDSFIQSEGLRRFGEIGVANARCKKCGHKAKVIKHVLA